MKQNRAGVQTRHEHAEWCRCDCRVSLDQQQEASETSETTPLLRIGHTQLLVPVQQFRWHAPKLKNQCFGFTRLLCFYWLRAETLLIPRLPTNQNLNTVHQSKVGFCTLISKTPVNMWYRLTSIYHIKGFYTIFRVSL